MFSGKLTHQNYSGLYVNGTRLHTSNLWSLEGKRWDNDKKRLVKILPYADTVYVSQNGDMWYYASQNNDCTPIVRIADRLIVYNLMHSLGFDIAKTDSNS
jgi:hypothetical protein